MKTLGLFLMLFVSSIAARGGGVSGGGSTGSDDTGNAQSSSVRISNYY